MTITLTGEPKSTSHIYHYHCKSGFPKGYMTADGRSLKESYQWQAKSQWKQKPLKESIYVKIGLFFGTKRRVDIDNFNKLTLDSLSGIVWEDDSQIQTLVLTKHYDKENPRVEVTVENKEL